MSPTLPPELVEKVLIHALDELEATKTDLLHVCLANKHFLEIAFPLLHLRRSFTSDAGEGEGHLPGSRTEWDELRKWGNAGRIVALAVSCLPDSCMADIGDFRTTLVSLRIDHSEGDELGFYALAELKNLAYLSVSGTEEDPASLAALLRGIASLPSLIHLSLKRFQAWEEDSDDESLGDESHLSFPPSLVSLHLREVTGNVVDSILIHACTFTPSLRLYCLSLFDVDVYLAAVATIVQSHSSSLRVLSLSLDRLDAPCDFLFLPLQLSCLGINVGTANFGTFVAFLWRLRPHLQAGRVLGFEKLVVAGERKWDPEGCSQFVAGACSAMSRSDDPLRATLVRSGLTAQRDFVELTMMITFQRQAKRIIYADSLLPSFPPVGTEQLLRRGEALRRAMAENEENGERD
jgi:hypothetical protein